MGNILPPTRVKRQKPDKTALIAAANTLLAAVGEHADLDLITQVYLTATTVGVEFGDDNYRDIARFREPYDPIEGHRFKSDAEIGDKLAGGWL